MTDKTFDPLDFIMALECDGDLTEEEVIDGFQHLIDDGSVWNLQGSYGRMAASLIERGYCHAVVPAG